MSMIKTSNIVFSVEQICFKFLRIQNPNFHRLFQASYPKCQYRDETNTYMTIYNLLHISDMFGTMGTVLKYDDYVGYDYDNNDDDECYLLYRGYLKLYTSNKSYF